MNLHLGLLPYHIQKKKLLQVMTNNTIPQKKVNSKMLCMHLLVSRRYLISKLQVAKEKFKSKYYHDPSIEVIHYHQGFIHFYWYKKVFSASFTQVNARILTHQCICLIATEVEQEEYLPMNSGMFQICRSKFTHWTQVLQSSQFPLSITSNIHC